VRAVSLDVLAYLPAPLQSHLRVVLGATRGHVLTAPDRWEQFLARKSRFETNLATLDRTLVRAEAGDRVPASQLLRQPEVRLEWLIGEGRVRLDIDPEFASVDIASATPSPSTNATSP